MAISNVQVPATPVVVVQANGYYSSAFREPSGQSFIKYYLKKVLTGNVIHL